MWYTIIIYKLTVKTQMEKNGKKIIMVPYIIISISINKYFRCLLVYLAY